MTELATSLVNGGSIGTIDHFMVAEGILDQVDNDGKITLLMQKQDTLSRFHINNVCQIQLRLGSNARQGHRNLEYRTPQYSLAFDQMMNESGHIDDISVPSVLCIVREWTISQSPCISYLISSVQNFFDALRYVEIWVICEIGHLKHEFDIPSASQS